MIASAVKSLLRPHRVIRIANLRDEEARLKERVADSLIAFTVDDPRYREEHYTEADFMLADCQIAIEEEVARLNAPLNADDIGPALIIAAAFSVPSALIAMILRLA